MTITHYPVLKREISVVHPSKGREEEMKVFSQFSQPHKQIISATEHILLEI